MDADVAALDWGAVDVVADGPVAWHAARDRAMSVTAIDRIRVTVQSSLEYVSFSGALQREMSDEAGSVSSV